MHNYKYHSKYQYDDYKMKQGILNHFFMQKIKFDLVLVGFSTLFTLVTDISISIVLCDSKTEDK